MGQLQHIAESLGQQGNVVDAIFKSAGEHIANSVVQKLTTDMRRGGDGINQIKAAVAAVEPAVRIALGELTNQFRRELKASADQLTGTQRALMQTLAQIQIPDHSEALNRIESRAVDLSPVERQLEAMALHMGDHHPREWLFTVKRNPKTNLIETVTAEAVE